MILKPQDILVLLKLAILDAEEWSYASLAKELFISHSEVHAGIQRATISRLYSFEEISERIINHEYE